MAEDRQQIGESTASAAGFGRIGASGSGSNVGAVSLSMVTAGHVPIRPAWTRQCSAPKLPCSTIAFEGAVAPGDHQRAAHSPRGFTVRSRRFEDSMETGEMES